MLAKQLQIKQTWDGTPVTPSEQVSIFFSLDHNELKCRVEAPFHGDRPPCSPPGQTTGLWDYEVVELFLLGASGAYLEVELGPHGHYLVYYFKDIQQLCRSVLPLRVSCSIEGRRWQGEISIALADLPPGISHVNGYAIHGQGVGRCYLATAAVAGTVPDFHQPRAFLPLSKLADWIL